MSTQNEHPKCSFSLNLKGQSDLKPKYGLNFSSSKYVYDYQPKKPVVQCTDKKKM